ncbi:hypothetical protein [uncultured Fusobacterium sp.]|nr:hypothetical protein [uncultured Fusobacterium sp.]
MKKLEYEKPEVEVFLISKSDVITTSSITEGELEGGETPDF